MFITNTKRKTMYQCFVLILFIVNFNTTLYGYDYEIDYGSTAYEDEGNILLKLNLGYLNANGKHNHASYINIDKNNIILKSDELSDIPDLIKHGQTLNISTSMFINDHIGLEGLIGLQRFGIAYESIKSISKLSEIESPKFTEQDDLYRIYSFIGSLGVRLDVAPYAGIRSYLTFGVNGRLFWAKTDEINLNYDLGCVAKAGVDFISKDNTIFNIEGYKYFSSDMLIKYGSDIVADTKMESRLKINSWGVSVGIGLLF